MHFYRVIARLKAGGCSCHSAFFEVKYGGKNGRYGTSAQAQSADWRNCDAKLHLATTTPRQVKRVMQEGLGKMLYEGRRIVTVEDVKTDTLDSAVQRIGFLP